MSWKSVLVVVLMDNALEITPDSSDLLIQFCKLPMSLCYNHHYLSFQHVLYDIDKTAHSLATKSTISSTFLKNTFQLFHTNLKVYTTSKISEHDTLTAQSQLNSRFFLFFSSFDFLNHFKERSLRWCCFVVVLMYLFIFSFISQNSFYFLCVFVTTFVGGIVCKISHDFISVVFHSFL